MSANASMRAMHVLVESLLEHRESHHDLLIHEGVMYRISVERIPAEETVAAVNHLLEEKDDE